MAERAASRPQDAARPGRPWFLWLTEASPYAPLATALFAALGLVVVQLAAWALLSRAWGFPLTVTDIEIRTMLFFAVVLAFGPVGVAWCALMAQRDLRDLEPVLTVAGRELDDLRARLERLPAGQVLGLAAGLNVAALVGMEANVGRISTVLGPDRTPFDGYVVAVSILSMFVLVGPLLLMLRLAAGFREIGREHVRIDLFDLSSLAPFGRFGVRTSLVPLGVFGLALGVGTNIHVGGVAVATLVIGGMSAAAVLLPSLGVRRRVVQAKSHETTCITRALQGDAAALGESRVAADADRLTAPDLLAYRTAVEDLREWPIANDGWRRFGAYLLIPLLTWTAKAAISGLLSRVF